MSSGELSTIHRDGQWVITKLGLITEQDRILRKGCVSEEPCALKAQARFCEGHRYISYGRML